MNKLNHIAFIMDGNGRWGKKKRRGRNYGHLRGVETVKQIVKYCVKSKIGEDQRQKYHFYLILLKNILLKKFKVL